MTENPAPHTPPHRWVKPTAEYAPLIGFFISYWGFGLNIATAVLVCLTVIATLLSRTLLGRLPLMPLIAAGLVVLFGGLTLLFDDERFIKMKPTIVQIAMAAVLLISAYIRRPILMTMLGNSLNLPHEKWLALSYRFALFFLVMAGLNEYVWRQYSTDFWVNFKFFGLTGLTFVFSLSQVLYIMRHTVQNTDSATDTDNP
jgi:intracellular septation protein